MLVFSMELYDIISTYSLLGNRNVSHRNVQLTNSPLGKKIRRAEIRQRTPTKYYIMCLSLPLHPAWDTTPFLAKCGFVHLQLPLLSKLALRAFTSWLACWLTRAAVFCFGFTLQPSRKAEPHRRHSSEVRTFVRREVSEDVSWLG